MYARKELRRAGDNRDREKSENVARNTGDEPTLNEKPDVLADSAGKFVAVVVEPVAGRLERLVGDCVASDDAPSVQDAAPSEAVAAQRARPTTQRPTSPALDQPARLHRPNMRVSFQPAIDAHTLGDIPATTRARIAHERAGLPLNDTVTLAAQVVTRRDHDRDREEQSEAGK